MNKPSDINDKENADLSAFYQNVSRELPSSELDSTILSQAKQATKNKKLALPSNADSAPTSPNQQTHSWRKWQWPAGLAASLVLVSVLWFKSSDEPEGLAFPDASTIELANAPSQPSLASDSLVSEPVQQQTIHTFDVAIEAEKADALQRSSLVVENGAQGQQAAIQDSVEEIAAAGLASTASKVGIDTPIGLQLQSDTSDTVDNLPQSADALLAKVKANRENEASKAEQTEAEVSHTPRQALSMTTMTQQRPAERNLDAELEAAWAEIQHYQRALYTTEIQNAEDENALIKKMNNTQQILIKLIQYRQQQQSDWEVPLKYLEVLTPDQRKTLQNSADKPQ